MVAAMQRIATLEKMSQETFGKLVEKVTFIYMILFLYVYVLCLSFSFHNVFIYITVLNPANASL